MGIFDTFTRNQLEVLSHALDHYAGEAGDAAGECYADRDDDAGREAERHCRIAQRLAASAKRELAGRPEPV